MAWFLLTALLGLVAVGALVFTSAPQSRVYAWAIFVGALGLWLIVTCFFIFSTVEAGHVGLVRTFSNYTGTQEPGVNLKAPWQSVVEANVQVQSERIIMDSRLVKGSGSAVSKETQPVYAVVTLNYRVNPAKVLDLYRNVGVHYFEAIIEPRVQQVFKSQTVNYSTVEVAPNREQIRRDTQETLDAQLEQYGIEVTDFLINNLDFAPEFVEAITAKQVATQSALAAQAKVAQAKAEADQAVETARGEAQAIAIKGKALRDNPEILRLTAIEKLNPNVQTIYVPSNSNLFLPAARP